MFRKCRLPSPKKGSSQNKSVLGSGQRMAKIPGTPKTCTPLAHGNPLGHGTKPHWPSWPMQNRVTHASPDGSYVLSDYTGLTSLSLSLSLSLCFVSFAKLQDVTTNCSVDAVAVAAAR